MPSIKDQSTVEAIAREYTSNGRNKTETLKAIGYSESYYNGGRSAEVVWGNERVIAAIARIDEKTAVKHEHNQQIAIDLLRSDYANLKTRADNGDIQAIQARTAIVRELNACTGQHSSTLHTKPTEQQALTPAETEAIAALNRQYKLRLSKETA